MADTIVIFGASGDLTSRKLIPALYRLFIKGRLPEGSRIVGVSRSDFGHQQWRDSLRETSAKFVEAEFINHGNAVIQIHLTEKTSVVMKALRDAGFKFDSERSASLLIGRIAVDKLSELAKIKEVRFVLPWIE